MVYLQDRLSLGVVVTVTVGSPGEVPCYNCTAD
jgi:hypothetical protein